MVLPLILVVAIAFSVEAALGFGATLVAVALGALIMPIEQLLPALVPLNVALSLSIALRNRDAISWPTLTKDIAPRMLLGLPLGLFVFRAFSSTHLRAALGALVIALAIAHFVRAHARTRTSTRTIAVSVPFARSIL